MLLGEILTQLGHASNEQISAALAHQKGHGGYLGAILVAIGAITTEQLVTALRVQRELSMAESLETAAAA
jgi:hypothetical protein